MYKKVRVYCVIRMNGREEVISNSNNSCVAPDGGTSNISVVFPIHWDSAGLRRPFSRRNIRQDASPRRVAEEPAGTGQNRVDQSDLRPSDLPDPSALPEIR